MKIKEVSISASAVMALLTVENFSDLHVFAAAFYVNTCYIILTKEEQKREILTLNRILNQSESAHESIIEFRGISFISLSNYLSVE